MVDSHTVTLYNLHGFQISGKGECLMTRRVTTKSGTTISLVGPTEYIRNGKEHQCIMWGAATPAPMGEAASGAVIIGAPTTADTPFGQQAGIMPIQILLGQIVVGQPLAFLRDKDGRLDVIISTAVVEVEDEDGAGPLPDDLLKKLM